MVDQTRAIAPFEPEHFTVGTACGSGTPDGSRLPGRNLPSEDGSVAQVNGRIGWIAVNDDFGGTDAVVGVLDVGAGELDCDDAGSDDVGCGPTGELAAPPPDEVHPVTATTTSPAAKRKIT
jgi:hypothetical protein